MRSSATRGTGQFRLNVLTSAIVIVSGAGAFGRYHGRTQRIFRRTLHSESRALVRLFQTLKNHSTDTVGRLTRWFAGEREAAVGVVFLKPPAQLEATGRNLTESAPLPRANFEDFGD